MNYLKYIIGEKHFKGKRKHIKTYKMSQPHFEGVVRSPLTLPKMGLGSP
jgi:hypothetical protein